MNKYVLCFLTVVVVSTRCGAKSISALTNSSAIAVAHSTQADEHDIQSFLEAPTEERAPFDIESFISSVKITDESLLGSLHATNVMDVPQIKERNIVLATLMETLGINIDGVVAVTKASKFDFKRFSQNSLEWMVLGKVFFGSSTGYGSLSTEELFEGLNMKFIDKNEFLQWKQRIRDFKVEPDLLFGKMLWLLQHHNEFKLHLADAAKMAFGSEYFNRRKLPISDQIVQEVTKKKIDKDVMESLIRQDIDSRKLYRKPFAIESFTSSVTNADKSLPRTEHEADMMDVSQIKERNKLLASRMEQLGIDIDGIVFVTKVFENAIFSLNNLEWMVLGKVYFEKAKSSTDFSRMHVKTQLKLLNMQIIDEKEFAKWKKRVVHLSVPIGKVFNKMLLLMHDEKETNLDVADAAKMAFGSEYFKKITMPIDDGLFKTLTEKNVEKDVTESPIRQDKDLTMKDIAEETLSKKATRKYVGEESQEQPTNKNRKLA